MELTRIKNEETTISFPMVDLNGDSASGLAGLVTYIAGWNNDSSPSGFVQASSNPTGISGGDYCQHFTAEEMNYDYLKVKIISPSTDIRVQRLLINNRTIPISIQRIFEEQLPDGYPSGSFGNRMGNLLSIGGAGSSSGTITITNDQDVPIANASVWVTTDAIGANIVAGSLTTNALGKVTFYLETGITYYIWAHKSGVNFSNPQQVVW